MFTVYIILKIGLGLTSKNLGLRTKGQLYEKNCSLPDQSENQIIPLIGLTK